MAGSFLENGREFRTGEYYVSAGRLHRCAKKLEKGGRKYSHSFSISLSLSLSLRNRKSNLKVNVRADKSTDLQTNKIHGKILDSPKFLPFANVLSDLWPIRDPLLRSRENIPGDNRSL